MPACTSLLNFHSKIFRDETYPRFIMQFVEEIKEALTQLDVWLAFSVFDPRKLPENLKLKIVMGKKKFIIHGMVYKKVIPTKAKQNSKKKIWKQTNFEQYGQDHLMHEQRITYQKTSTSILSTKNQKRVKKVWDYQNHNICHLNF